jgi:hypothetical protein
MVTPLSLSHARSSSIPFFSFSEEILSSLIVTAIFILVLLQCGLLRITSWSVFHPSLSFCFTILMIFAHKDLCLWFCCASANLSRILFLQHLIAQRE